MDNGTVIKETFVANQAVWHKSCYLRCNNTKLKRAKVRKRKLDEDAEPLSPVKTRSMNDLEIMTKRKLKSSVYFVKHTQMSRCIRHLQRI